MLISSARLYVHKNVKIAYICIMYIPVWPHNGVKSFLEEHSYFSASVFFIPYDVLVQKVLKCILIKIFWTIPTFPRFPAVGEQNCLLKVSNSVLPEREIREMCYQLSIVGIVKNIFISECFKSSLDL